MYFVKRKDSASRYTRERAFENGDIERSYGVEMERGLGKIKEAEGERERGRQRKRDSQKQKICMYTQHTTTILPSSFLKHYTQYKHNYS